MDTHIHRTIGSAAVLGAGVMGSGIAALLAAAGIRVLLLDVVPDAPNEEERAKGLTQDSPAFRNRFAKAGLQRIKDKRAGLLYSKRHLDLIQIGNLTDDFDSLAQCDWILEVIVERLDIKRDLMKRIEQVRSPGSIVSTNTSGVSVNAIAAGFSEEFRKHFLGTHFFNPPRYMHLFEIIPAADTSPEIVNFMSEFAATHLGKGVVPAKDTPNFVGNRIGTYATVRAVQLTQQYGYSFPLVDQLTGIVLGRPKSATFRTLDMVGLDIFINVARNVVSNVTDPAEIALFDIPDYVSALVEIGALGDKTGGGFYKKVTVDSKRSVLGWNPQSKEYEAFEQAMPESVKQALNSGNKYEAMVYGETDENRFAWECIKGILLYSAARVPEIADDFRLIDQAMVWGYNWEKGPFAIWDDIGLERSVARMRAEGEDIPGWIANKLQEGDTLFYGAHTQKSPYLQLNSGETPVVSENSAARLLDIGDGVACLEFISKGNAISSETMDMFADALDRLESNEWKGLVIGNHGKNFSAGANLEQIGRLAQEGDEAGVREQVARLQSTMLRMKYAKHPVVAAPHGMALGGGMEITLHASDVCAHAESYMGLVEAGVGLVPGAGGCKELLSRTVDGCTAYDKVVMLPRVKKLWRNIATAAVSSSAFDAQDKGFMRESNRIVMNAEQLLAVAKQRVLELAAGGYQAPARRRIPVLGEFGRASILFDLQAMLDGGFVSEHDALIARKLAFILTGGGVAAGTLVSEEYLVDLEKTAFSELCKEEKTVQRIAHMLKTGKPLRN